MVKGNEKFQKLNNDEKISLMFDLINSFRIVRNPLETAFFLQDLLTANEIRNLSIRLRIAKLLLSGNNYRDIIDEIHTSFATITKVSVWLESGGEGFKNVIKRLPLKWNKPKNMPKGPIEFHLPQTIFALVRASGSEFQDKKVTKFADSLKKKEGVNRLLQKEFDEQYKEISLGRRSINNRAHFKKKIDRKSK